MAIGLVLSELGVDGSETKRICVLPNLSLGLVLLPATTRMARYLDLLGDLLQVT